MDATPESILRLDRTALKVLAHPLRSRLLMALRSDGPATATTLAQRLETNTGATSYHLRKLGSVGLVEETPDGRGRERMWRAATEMHGWRERDVADDPDAAAATDWLRRHHLRSFIDRYQAWLDVQGSWPIEWRDAADASDYALRLSPARLAAFDAEVAALIERYRTAADDDGSDVGDDQPDREMVQVYLFAFPMDGHPR